MINLGSSGPIGLGELENLTDCNSILTLKTRAGTDASFKLWINDFSSDLNMEIDIAQLRAGYSYRPIRIQERTLSFTTIWSLANRPKYEALVDAVREHWAYNMNETVPTPAYFTYFGANKTFKGYILSAQRSYAVPDTLLSYTFEMKLVTSSGIEDAAKVIQYSYYIPRAADVAFSGLDYWYSGTELYDPILGPNNSLEPYVPSGKIDTIADNTTEAREGGIYRTPEETSALKTTQENRATIICWYVNKMGADPNQAAKEADKILNNNQDYSGMVKEVAAYGWNITPYLYTEAAP